MQVKLVAGRDIDIYNYPTDSFAVLLNETAVQKMRLKNPIGANVIDNGMDSVPLRCHVVGVVKDFIIEEVSSNVAPMIIFGPKEDFNTIHYRLNPAKPIQENLETIKKIFKKYNPDYPFEYHFVSEEYANKFKETQRMAQLSSLFAGLTIFISCLGLLGLIMFIAESRTKEIGVRKVLGASVKSIVALLTKDFMFLVLIAFVIAAPVEWYVMHKWLSNYEYRISIAWWWFLLAGIIAELISFATVSRQAIKAAKANPVKSLKTE
jgi:ABC-type antimicrobial peptide transport system permease subunit